MLKKITGKITGKVTGKIDCLKKFWAETDVDTVVNKRQMIFGAMAVAFVGLLLGMIFSAKVNVTINSYGDNDENDVEEEAPKRKKHCFRK